MLLRMADSRTRRGHTLHVDVDRDLAKKVASKAKAEDMTIAQIVRRALRRYLAEPSAG